MNNIESPADIERARTVFERAITAVGLHVVEVDFFVAFLHFSFPEIVKKKLTCIAIIFYRGLQYGMGIGNLKWLFWIHIK